MKKKLLTNLTTSSLLLTLIAGVGGGANAAFAEEAANELTTNEATNSSYEETKVLTSTARPMIISQVHVQKQGWIAPVEGDGTSGTVGKGLRLEGIKLKTNFEFAQIQYQVHVQKNGWMPEVSNGALAGTTGEAKRLEAIKIKLTGDGAENYDIYYRVHAQTFGWLDWAKNGEAAGSAGYAKRLEAIQILVVNKGEAAPGATATPFKDKNNSVVAGENTANDPVTDNTTEENLAGLTQEEFIQSVSSHAVQVANQNNLYPSIMIAQAALESGYGASKLSLAPNHNLFGIKGSYNGSSVEMPTSEYQDGKWVQVNAAFRKYPSYSESFADNAKLLRNGLTSDANFYSGTWRENASTYEDAAKALQGKYATDPNYASKLTAIIKKWNLTQYD